MVEHSRNFLDEAVKVAPGEMRSTVSRKRQLHTRSDAWLIESLGFPTSRGCLRKQPS